LVAAPLRTREQRRADRDRALRLATAAAVAALGTLANPAGVHAYLAYLAAGNTTPSLERVRDEWAPLHLFALPETYQPSLLAWAIAWAMLAGLAWLLVRAIRPNRSALRGADPAKLAVSLVSFALLLTAVRFLWLGIFPLLSFACAARESRSRRGAAWIGAAAMLLAAGFVNYGDRLVTRDGMLSWFYYQRPYPTGKHHADAIWLLGDSGVRGSIYHEYFMGGFTGYWLAPDVRSLVNGTLNVPGEFLDALGAIARAPGCGAARRSRRCSTGSASTCSSESGCPSRRSRRHLVAYHCAPREHAGWTRSIGTSRARSICARTSATAPTSSASPTTTLRRVVPFDRERGFDVDAVIRDAPDWAIAHGVVPRGFLRMARDAFSGHASGAVSDRVAAVSAVLGRYDRAIAIDRVLVRSQPDWVNVRRRLTWSLLRLGQIDEAAEVAAPLAARPPGDELSSWIVDTVREIPTVDPDRARAAIASLPFLTRAEATALQASLEPTEPRPAR